MQFRLSAIFVGALLAVATPAFAVNIKTPRIASYDLACEVVNGQQNTVKFTIDPQNFGILIYRFRFTNATTGQTLDFHAGGPASGNVSFPVPQGSYVPTVSLIPAVSSPPVASSAVVTLPNIAVPQVVATPGSGTGCMFAQRPVLTDSPALKR